MDFANARVVSESTARELGITVDDAHRATCRFCGNALEAQGLLDGEDIFWIGHVECDCPEKRAHEQREREREERLRKVELERKILACGIGKRYANAEVSLEAATRYLDAFEGSGGKGLYISGCVGSGKTYAASALARSFVVAGYKAVFTTSLKMLDEIRASYEGNREAGIGRYSRCDILFIDDIGKENANAWALTTLFQVINDRYEAMLPTIYTSQYALEALVGRMSRSGERESAEAIVSRIAQTSETIRLRNRDRRKDG